MAKGNAPRNGTHSSANLGFEAKLWLAAESQNAAEIAEGNRSCNMAAAEPSSARQPERSGDSPAYAI